MLKIGIDAMGGDFAPEAAVKGAMLAAEKLDQNSRIVLFGDTDQIVKVIEAEGGSVDMFDIVHTTEVIEMGDHPAKAFVKKADSSITRGFMSLAKGEIDGFASAGSTGAMMVGSTQVIGAIDGVIRPTISSPLPTVTGRATLLLDVGLNVDCKPEVLAQYGLLGSIYAQYTLGIENPRVAILNIGEESTKGNAQSKATYELMSQQKGINFVGNVESSYIFTSKIADVIVCDGFLGNTVLKMAEGLYRVNKAINKEVESNPFWEAMNYENIGGTPVIGVGAPVVIGHGSSSPKAIASMTLTTERIVRSEVVKRIKERLSDSI